MAGKVTRAKITKAIPFSFGILQNIADDLRVTRSAVSRFINLPDNSDLKELITEEGERISDYAKMNVARNLITGDIEAAKWFLSTFPKGLKNPRRKYKSKKDDWKNQPQITFERSAQKLRQGFYNRLMIIDRTREDINPRQLPGRKEIIIHD
ncbi:MAG: hypothetical protein JST55_02950 [Bacteroidetes bacterium]|nr:hypothetical protein [Bacteroidota bacterium]